MLRFRFPKDDSRYRWTNHVKSKMLFYGLGEGRIRRVLKSPKRVDEGIAPETIAVMQRNDRGSTKEEIWVMYCSLREPRTVADFTQTNAEKATREKIPRMSAPLPRKSAEQPRLLMISAWRYPGISKPGTAIPIPDDIFAELTNPSTEFDKI